jgi:hypothetical protein
MTNSTRLIADLDKLISTDFSPSSQANASNHPEGPKNLVMMAATALLEAGRLKTLLLEIRAITDRNDPQFALIESILATLD